MMDLVLNQISFSYPTGQVLSDISCRFSQGEFHAVLGPNGSGKTTLLDIMAGFIRPQKGQAVLGGIPVHRQSKRDLARKVSLVTQSYEINFPFTVAEVVLMGRHPYVDRFSRPSSQDLAKAQAAMELTGIAHLRDQRVTELSGGEKQRCVFARALCQDTAYLFLDEAFSNMDISHTLHLLGLLRQMTREAGKTVVAVLHDLNLAAGHADAILFLKNGRAQAQGRADEVFNEQVIAQVFNVKAKVEFNEFTASRQAFFKI